MSRPPGNNGVQTSGYEELIRTLLEDRWPPNRVVDYLKRRYQVELTQDQVRHYRDRVMDKTKIRPPSYIEEKIKALVSEVDIAEERAKLIKYQLARIERDGKHEETLGKNFPNQLKEIELLNRMLSDHKADLQTFGVIPRDPPSTEINVNASAQVSGMRVGDSEQLKDDEEVRNALRVVGAKWKPTGQ